MVTAGLNAGVNEPALKLYEDIVAAELNTGVKAVVPNK
jgi:hypothetical protein